MDHHGDWDQWHEDGSGMDSGDTADLPGGHLGDHDHLPGYDSQHEGYDSYEDGDSEAPAPDLSHGPDLVHEGGTEPHEDLTPDHDDAVQDNVVHDALGADHDLSPDHDDQPGPADHLVGVDPDLPAGPDAA
jgi:hypothetical protein